MEGWNEGRKQRPTRREEAASERIRCKSEGEGQTKIQKSQNMAHSRRITRTHKKLNAGDRCRQERWILNSANFTRLTQNAIALASRNRGATTVIDASVPTEINRALEAREPEANSH